MFSSRIINSKQLRRIKSLIIIVNLNLKGYTFFIHTVDFEKFQRVNTAHQHGSSATFETGLISML
jgi:hypothetical protein